MSRLNAHVTATGIPDMVLASGAWPADNVFEAGVRFIENCFREIVTFTFEGDRIHVRVADTYPGVGQSHVPSCIMVE
jgi:hypothetical protein